MKIGTGIAVAAIALSAAACIIMGYGTVVLLLGCLAAFVIVMWGVI